MAETVDDPSAWGAVSSDDSGPASWGAVSDPSDWGAVPADQDEPSPAGSFLRQGARSIGAGIGAGIGMVGGAALTAPTVVGTIPGAIAGGVAGGMAGQSLEDWLLDKLGLAKGTGQLSDVQQQKDIETNPLSAFAGGMAGNILPSFGVGAGARVGSRLIGAGIQGGLETGQEAYRGEDLDPGKIGIATAAGAAFAKPRGWVNNLESRLGARGAPATAAEPPAAETPSRKLNLPPDEVTDEGLPAEQPSTQGPPSRFQMEAQVARENRDNYEPGSDFYKLWDNHAKDMDDEASKQPPVRATGPGTLHNDGGLGTAKEAAPTEDTNAGQPKGEGPMREPRSDGPEDYRKAKPEPAPETQDSSLMTTGDRAPDVDATFNPTQPQTTAIERGVQGKPEQPAPVDTGIPQKPAPVPPASDADLVKQATQLAMRRPIVEAPLPEGMNSHKDINGPIYANPVIPKTLRRFGAIHETVEQALMARGKPYAEAHDIATKAEEDAVQKAGIPLDQYKEAWRHALELTKDAPGDPSLPLHVPSEEAIGHHLKGGVTAAETLTPEQQKNIGRVRAALPKLGGALEQFDALPVQERIARASNPEIVRRLENYRAPEHNVTEEGFKTNRKAGDAERKDNSTRAVKAAVAGLPEEHGLTTEHTAENRADIIKHATDLRNDAKTLYGGKDPTKFVKGDPKSGFLPTPADRLPEHNLVDLARKVAMSKDPDWELLEKYVTAVELRGEIGAKVDEGIARSKRPGVEDVEGNAPLKPEGRMQFEPFTENDIPNQKFLDRAGYEPDEYMAEQNRLRTGLNELPDAAYNRLLEMHPEIEKDIAGTHDPVELMRQYTQDLAEAGGKRPGVVDYPPKGPGKRTPITNAADLLKSLANSEEGGISIPKFISDRFAPRPEDPTNPARSPEVKQHLDFVAKATPWIRSYANELSSNMLRIWGDHAAWEAHQLTDAQKKNIELADVSKIPQSLSGKEAEAYKLIAPMAAKGDKLYEGILNDNKTLNLGIRNLEEMAPGFDYKNAPRIQRQGDDIFNPDTGNVLKGNRFSLNADVIKPREWMGLLDQATGDRVILHRGDDGKFSIAQNGNLRPINKLPASFEGKVGEVLPLSKGGKLTKFVVDHAATDEIEAATAGGDNPVKFVHDPFVTYANRLNQLQRIRANIDLIQKFKTDPWWKDNTFTDSEIKPYEDIVRRAERVIPKTAAEQEAVADAKDKVNAYRSYDEDQTKLNALGYRNGKDGAPVRMPKNVRWLLDDMVQQGFGGGDSNFLGNAGNIMARTFLVTGSPIHVGNMATNAVIARGYDNITPQGLKSLATHGYRAFQAMRNPGNSTDLHKALEAGVHFQFPNVVTQDLIPTMMKQAGLDVAKNPSKWDPIAKTLGFSPPDLARAIERFSTGEMWRVGDMFPLQRFLELTEGKGMDPKAAADEVNKFSSYATGPTFGSTGNVGRFMQNVMTDQRTALFGRWHMLLMRGMAHIGRDAFGPDRTNQQRGMAASQMIAAGALAYAAYPAVDYALRSMTGNPDAEVGRRGMLAVEDGVRRILKGDADYAKAVGTMFTPAIPLNMIAQGLRNQQWTGKPIVPPMTYNTPRKGAVAAANIGDWAAGTAIPPYGAVAGNLTRGDTLAGAAGKFTAGMVGAKIPSDATRNAMAKEPKRLNQDYKQEVRNPHGPLSWLATHYGR